MSAEKMAEMKVFDLKRALKARGLPTSGNKGELIERLQATACSSTDTIRDIHCSLEFLSNTTVSDEDEVFPPESLDIPTAGNNGSEVAMDSTEEPSAAGETSTPTLLTTTRFLPVNTMSNSVQHLVVSEPQVSGHYQPEATTLVDVHAACTAANRQADEPSQGATPTTATRAATPVLTPDSARTSQATVKSTNIAAAAEDSAAAVDDSISSVDCGSLELKADAKHDDTNQRYPLTCKVCAEMYKMRDAHEKRLEELEAQIGALSVRLDRASDGRRLSEVTKRISTLEFRINEAAKKNEALQTLVTALSGHAVAAGQTGDSMVTEDGTSSAPSESEGENQMSSETELHHSAMTLNDATKAGVDKQGNALQDDRPQDAGSAINNTNNVTAHTDTQCDEVPSKTSSGVTHMSTQEIHVPVAAKKLTHEDVPIRPPRGITREVIIAGDGNVLRIARALIEEVEAPKSMEFITNRGATTEVVHKIIETYEEKARNVPRMYILHVGLNDVLKGEQPDTIIERLRLQWAKRKASLAICSVPEIDGRGKELRATTMLLNAKLKQLCKRIRARFIDLSRELASIPAMQKDGLHYCREGSQVLTDRVGALVTHF
ncbi:hypothetical protein ISCGN_009600 [Ixodes scapularis]